MKKNDNVIKSKNEMIEQYLGCGTVREFRMSKGFVIITSESKDFLERLEKFFKTNANTKVDEESIKAGFVHSFHITFLERTTKQKSNIFIASSDEDVIKEQFEKVLNAKKLSQLGEKKVVSIVKGNKVSYKTVIEEDEL